MNLGELFKTKRWKTFMGYIYGWGAAIVMIGALFKLQHWNYSGLLLTIGLITEAFIFFLSAFEPPLETPEWSRVYPELRDDYEIGDFDELKPRSNKGLSELFSSSELTPELLDKVGKGLNELSNSARGISDITSATLATDMYVKNLNSASDSMAGIADVNNRVNESLASSFNALLQSYTGTAQQLNNSGKKLAEIYESTSQTLNNDVRNIGDSSKQYSDSLKKLSSNINVFNDSFESQMKGTLSQIGASQKFSSDLQKMNEVLASSVDELKKYKENAEQLNKHLEALNTIYGNMLGAMSYRK
jgi:gliding motility-associated protein GldL